MKTPEEIATEHAFKIAQGDPTVTATPEALAEFMRCAIEAYRAQPNRYIVDEENVAIRDTYTGQIAGFLNVTDDVRAACDRLNSGEDPHDTYAWWDPKEGS